MVVAGYMHNGANFDFAVYRYNPNGTLDTTFSGDGIALQPNGKIVLAGFKETPTDSFFAVTHLNTNGTLDTTFKGTGKATTTFGVGSGAHGRDVRVQSDGKIIVIGHAKGNYAFARYTTTGALDTSFSGDGKMLVDFGFDDIGWVIAVQPADGRYVLAGRLDDGTQSDIGLARLLP